MKYTKIEVEGIELVLQFNKDTNTVDIISVNNGQIGDVKCPIGGNVDKIYGDALYVGGDIIAGIGGSIIARGNGYVAPLPMVMDDQFYAVGSLGDVITINGNDKDEFLAGWKERLEQVKKDDLSLEEWKEKVRYKNEEDLPEKKIIVHVKENPVITAMEERIKELKEEDLQEKLKSATKANVKKISKKEFEQLLKDSKATLYTPVA